MGRSLLFGGVMCGILLVAATTRSDVASTSTDETVDDTASLPESITDTPVSPAATGEPAPKDPFAAFDVGPPESIWPYEALSSDEQTVIDRGRGTNGWQQMHTDYAAGVRERSRDARASAAQHALGIDDSFDYAGVVP